MTSVGSMATLFSGSGSGVGELTSAVLERLGPAAVELATVPRITIVTLEPSVMVPRLAEPVHGMDGVHSVAGELNVQYVSPVSSVGRTSVRLTACASDGPLLLAVIV